MKFKWRLKWFLISCILQHCSLYYCNTASAEMVSKCVVNGTQVDFHCSNVDWWRIDYGPDSWIEATDDTDTLTVNATIDDTYNTTTGFQTVDIACISDEYYFAILIITDEINPQVPLNISITAKNKTSLLIEWDAPVPLDSDIAFEAYLDQQKLAVNGTSVVVDLEGKECEPFQISISMPGNCEDFIVEGSLLVDPPYPKVEELMMVVLENKTIFLTWQQPYNIFDEDSFTYNITVMSNGHIVDQRVITLNTSQVPWEEFNFTNLEFCDEVNFTLTQEGDCREQHISTSLPIFPGEFVSELNVEIYYSDDGDVGIVQLMFQPPHMCDYQLETSSYILSVSDGNVSWTVGPERLQREVEVYDSDRFVRDIEYTATVTVITQYGNVSSTLNFSALGEAQLDSDSLVIEITEKNSIIVINWDNPTNTLSSSFTYVVSVVLVTTEVTIDQQTVVVTKESAPSAKFYSLEQYTCDKLNFSIHIFNTVGSIWSIITLPEYPVTFQQNTTADTIIIDGKIKELEVSFMPPYLCEFQSASYVMSFTSDNESWSRDPIIISDTTQLIKEDIETGFVLNRNYTVIITVIMNHGNLSSSDNFNFVYKIDPDLTITTSPRKSSGENSKLSYIEYGGIALAVLVAMLVAVVIAGVIGIYCLQLKKRKRADSAGALSSISGHEDCYTVMNPAGNITMMPRNNHHSGQQWGSTPAATGEG